MAKFYCEYCGTKGTSISNLVASSCFRHPLGSGKGKHHLYEGTEKEKYTCKYCGTSAKTISGLVASSCHRHPNGAGKGKHGVTLQGII